MNRIKILVTGAKGGLGHDVVKQLTALNINNIGADMGDFDITDKSSVFRAVCDYRPTAVIHCAAYTNVDKAEDEPEICRLSNEAGTYNIAQACESIGARMMYISTDYVFGGDGNHFNKPHDKTAPLSVYGKTKLAGEKAVTETLDDYFVVRTSWLFGHAGNNFVKTMLRLGKTHDEISVVSDQIGCPTYCPDIAALICAMIQSDKYGIYHATNEGTCSWAEFAREIFIAAKMNVKINEILSEQYPAKATRPKNSRLCKESLDAAGFPRLPRWQDALGRYFCVAG